MKFIQHVFFLALFLFPCFLKAQVPVQGNLKLGDTTQIHVLRTVKGDRFTGLVTEFDKEKLQFQYMGNVLEFSLNDVVVVEIVDAPDPTTEVKAVPIDKTPNDTDSLQGLLVEPIGEESAKRYVWPYEYRIQTTNGTQYTGILSRINATGVMLGKSGNSPIPIKDIKGIELMGSRLDTYETSLREHHRLKTIDADIFTGQLLSYDGQNYMFLMQNGSELTFPKQEVEYIYLVKKGRGGNFNYEEVKPFSQGYYNQQRIFFTPSAFLIEKGTKEFRTMLVSNSLDYGLSDHVTVGVGVHTVVVATGLSGKIKVGASLTDRIHFAAGAQGLVAFSVFDSETLNLGLVYGSLSIGTKEKFFNFAVGRGSDNQTSQATTAYTMGGSYRIGKHWRFYGEYMNFREDVTDPRFSHDTTTIMFTIGASWFKREHQVDLGLYGNDDLYGVNAFPVIGYSLRF